jgi:hypothetical protein
LSRPIVAVDGDIFLGEVAGQPPVAALAETERDFQRCFMIADTAASS